MEEQPTSQNLQDQFLESLLTRDLGMFHELLKHPDVNPLHKYGPPHFSTCLEIACQYDGCEEFVKAMLEIGVNPNIVTTSTEPIHLAATKGNINTLKVLLSDKRTKVNAVDGFGRTALHLAANNFGQGDSTDRYEQCIALLLSNPDIDVNSPNIKGCTAVYEAACYGGQEAVLVMLNYGSHVIDFDSSNGHVQSARDIIVKCYPELKSVLPPANIKQLHLEPHLQLLTALQNRELNVFRKLLCQVDRYGNALLNPNFWFSKPYNSTCLEIACRENGCEEFVEALLSVGADPNIANIITHKTPLHLCVQKGNHEALKILLKHIRTNVNMLDNDGRTPLHVAVEYYRGSDDHMERLKECISLLLQHKCLDVNKVDKNYNTAFHIAALKENKEIVQLMLEHDCLVLNLDSAQGPEQKTTREVLSEKFSDFSSLLPENSTLENCEQALKEILFQYLYRQETQDFIITLKININEYMNLSQYECHDGCNTFLQYASLHGFHDVVQLLLEYEADPNSTTEFDKRPPIVLASLRQNKDVLKCFLDLPPESNFNINAVDSKGNTALHYAAQNDDVTSVIALLSHGADIKLKNVFGYPPLPAVAVDTLLNYSLRTSHHFPEDEDYELIFDYSFLLAHARQNDLEHTASQEDAIPLVTNLDQESFQSVYKVQTLIPEMDLLFYLSQSKEHWNLLTHPIITSFLNLKWCRIRTTYYINLLLYVLFLMLLNVYIFMDYGLPNRHNGILNKSLHNNSNESSEDSIQETHLERFRTTYGNLIFFLLLFILFCHTIRELFKFVMSPSRYLLTLDNMLDMALVFITGIVLFNSWDEDEHRKLFTAFSLFLSWIELSLLIARLPKFSSNIEILKSVVKHYCFMFISYFLFIIAFSVSFYIFYHDNLESESEMQDFPTIWSSISKTIMLMTGGLYMSSLPNVSGYSSIILLLFIFLVIIVILNILTGIAVTYVKFFHDNAEILQVISRITLLYEIESILIYWNRFMEKICKFNCVSKMATYLNTALRKIILFPSTNPADKYISVFPNRNAKIIFSNDMYSFMYKMNPNILKEAINIISTQQTKLDLDNVRRSMHQSCRTYHQNFSKLYNDEIQNSFSETQKIVKDIEKNINHFHNKVENNIKNSDTNIKNLIEKCHLQLTHSQQILHDKQDQYERRLNLIEESQKQITHLLTKILDVAKYQDDETRADNSTHCK